MRPGPSWPGEQESLYSTDFLSTRATAPSSRRPGQVVVAVVRLLLLDVGGHRSEVKLYCVITPNRIIVKLCWSSHHQSSESEQHNQDHNQPSATQPKYSSQTQFTTIFCWELEVLKKDTRGPLRFHCLSGSASPWPWILTAFFPSAVMSLCAVISVGLWLVNCARPEADWHQTQSLRAQALDVVTKWGAHTRRVSCLHSPHLVSLYSWWPEYYAKLFSHFPVVICSRPCW